MKVKIDTREKFHVITLIEPILAANMTDELVKSLTELFDSPPKNVVLSLEQVDQMDKVIAEAIIRVQQQFYEQNSSFVVCSMKKQVETSLDEENLLEHLNWTPTESEAWDIVQMEEIERELLG